MLINKLDILKTQSKQLDRVDYCHVSRLIRELGISNMIGFKIPKNDFIFRIRPSEKNVIFNHTDLISFNPNPKDFGRANRKGVPLFYGSIAPPGALSPLETNSLEILNGLSKLKYNELEEKYVFTKDSLELTTGKWLITKDIPVIPIIFFEEFLNKVNIFKPLYKKYIDTNKNNKNAKDIIHFIASEFAKTEINTSDDYKISVAFTELMFEQLTNNFEAILYPSVRTNGMGYNIALTPRFVKNHLKLHSVCIQTLYFKSNIGILDYEKYTDNIKNDGSFKLVDIDPAHKKGRDWSLNELNKRLK